MKNLFYFGYTTLFISFLTLLSCNGSSEKKDTEAELPAAVIPGHDGSLVLNAESGIATGTGIKYMPEWKAFGWFRSGDKVDWTVEIPKAGEYKATLEWSVSDEEAGKEFLLEAGSEKITGTVEKSGSWETFRSADIGTLRLPEGKQTITFKANKEFDDSQALLDLRHIILTPVNP